MPNFDYAERARAVNEANAELHAAVHEAFELNGGRRVVTPRWDAALHAFYAAFRVAYPEALQPVCRGEPAAAVATDVILDFLEADPVFFRSGYLKERLLPELARRSLAPEEVRRLRALIVANAVRKPFRREFRRYCRAAIAVDGPDFREELEALARGDDAIATRARKVLDTLVRATPRKA